jgi:hypothetical protein
MTTAPKAAKKKKVLIQYFHDGEPISFHQNKISSIAYWYTKNINGPEPLTAADFRELLASKFGVTDPKTAFDVTLPNDIRITAKVVTKLLVPIPGDGTPVKKKAAPRKTAAAKKSPANTITRQERSRLGASAKAQGTAHKKWVAGGREGPEPSTVDLKAYQALTGRPTSAGAAKTTATTQALAAARRTPSARKTTTRTAAKPKPAVEAEEGGGRKRSTTRKAVTPLKTRSQRSKAAPARKATHSARRGAA